MRIIFVLLLVNFLTSSCNNDKKKENFESKKNELEQKLAPMLNKEYDSVEQITSEIEKTLEESRQGK